MTGSLVSMVTWEFIYKRYILSLLNLFCLGLPIILIVFMIAVLFINSSFLEYLAPKKYLSCIENFKIQRNSPRYHQLLRGRPYKAYQVEGSQSQVSAHTGLVPSYTVSVFLWKALRMGRFRKSFGVRKGRNGGRAKRGGLRLS